MLSLRTYPVTTQPPSCESPYQMMKPYVGTLNSSQVNPAFESSQTKYQSIKFFIAHTELRHPDLFKNIQVINFPIVCSDQRNERVEGTPSRSCSSEWNWFLTPCLILSCQFSLSLNLIYLSWIIKHKPITQCNWFFHKMKSSFAFVVF